MSVAPQGQALPLPTAAGESDARPQPKPQAGCAVVALLMRRDLPWLLCCAALFLALFWRAAPRMRFQYDEADYMVAARMGLRENLIEPSSPGFVAYVASGLRAVSGRVGRTELSESIRQSRDVSFYRHYHGPLYFHWLALLSRLTTAEHQVRVSGLLFHLLLFFSVFAGVVWLYGREGRRAAWVAALACLLSVINVRTSLAVSTHALYAWLALATLLAIARFVMTAETRALLAAVGGATLALCTLEYGVLLFVVLAATAWLVRRRLLAANPDLVSRRVAARAAMLFLGLCAVVWPAGVFKLSMLKGFLVLPYLALMRRDSFGNGSLAAIWSDRLSASPVEYLALAACLAAALWAFLRLRLRPELVPFALYAGLILVITLKSDTDRYLSSAPPALYVIGGAFVAERARRLRKPLALGAGAACGALLLLGALRAVPAQAASAADRDAAVAFLREQRDRLRTVLVPASCLPTMHYYVPELVLRSYLPQSGSEHVLARLRTTPVDAVLVARAAESGLGLAITRHFPVRRVARQDSADPICGPSIVYVWDRPRAESSPR